MNGSRPGQVAVVGGGVLGVSTAAQLARAGADVILVTEGELVSQASGRSLSWLNSAGLRSEHYHRLRMAGIDRYRTLSARNPGLDWLRFDGGLAWLAEDRADELHRQHEHELALGYDSQLLTADRVAEQVPGVTPDAVPAGGALWRAGEGWVDLPSLVLFLAEDFVRHGGRLVTNAGPVRVVTEGDGLAGVRSEWGEEFPAEVVVLAAGAAVPGLVAELGVRIPDASPTALLVATEPVAHGLSAVLNTPRVSLRPRPDGGLSVDADWASCHATRAADGRYHAPESVVEELLGEASRVLAGHPSLTAAWLGMGPKPVPGDGEPVLGRVDGIPGLHVAFTHSGATLGLIVGELLAYEVVRGSAHPMLADYNVRRFG
ncbi:MAG TPA: FAD-dependent oxidoreductase [Propionibacteriaceae bacterium]|nr:FAD-dependent oxidoreductase [Propionibacteriaceae bacterium]